MSRTAAALLPPTTAQAIALSARPRARPEGRLTVRSRQGSAPTAASAPANTDAVPEPEPAARIRQPDIPSSASVARQATQNNQINLSRVNVIGIFGGSGNWRALVRLPSGRVRNVVVGDRIDGGRSAAIGSGEVRYVKGGRNITLKMPPS